MAIRPKTFLRKYRNYKATSIDQYKRLISRRNNFIAKITNELQRSIGNSIKKSLLESLSNMKISIETSNKSYDSRKVINKLADSDQLVLDIKVLCNKINDSVLFDSNVQKIMQSILENAKEDAPIDKRYIGNYKPKEKKYKSRRVKNNQSLIITRTLSMPYFNNIRERAGFLSKRKDITGFKHESSSGRELRTVSNNFIDISFNGPNDEIPYSFSYEKRRDLKRMSAEDMRSLWYDNSNSSINSYKRRKVAGKNKVSNKVIATAFKDNKVHYGEEELKRSGLYNKELGEISFDPTRLGTDYNYAPMQHNNLQFEHLQGKAYFLYDAFSKHKRELVAAIKKALDKKVGK